MFIRTGRGRQDRKGDQQAPDTENVHKQQRQAEYLDFQIKKRKNRKVE
jgi:hypothetical protein